MVRERQIGIILVALLAAVLNPQNMGIVIMLGLIAIMLDARWHPAPSEPPPAANAPSRRAGDAPKPSAKSAG